MLHEIVTNKRVKNIIQLCIDWCLSDMATGLFRIRAQICNTICPIFIESTIFGNYHAYSSSFFVGKTIMWFIVKCWWLWMSKIFFWATWIIVYEYKWNLSFVISKCCHQSLSIQSHHILHVGMCMRELAFAYSLSSKKILLIHNHQHFTINQIIVFPTKYNEEYAW